MKIFIFLLAIISIANILPAQSVLNDIELAANAYRKLVDYQGRVATKAYDVKGNQIAEASSTTNIFKKGKRFRYEIGKNVVIIQPDRAMLLDFAYRTIALSKPNDYQLGADQSLGMLKAWVKEGIQFKFVGVKNGTHVYVAESKDDEFQRIEIAFNTQSKLMDHLYVWYNSEYNDEFSKVEYSFVHQSLEAGLSDDLFDLSRYVQAGPRGYQPVKAFSGFQLITD